MSVYRAFCCLLSVLPLSVCVAIDSACSQASSPNSVEALEPIRVTATRSPKLPLNVPRAISLIEKMDIQQAQPTLTLNESLYLLPGLFVTNPYNFAQDLRLSIRGFGARSPFGVRGIKILVDGIPQTLPDGISQVDGVDPGIVERIEVLRGPSGSLYGNASGGVVAVTTEDGPDAPLQIEPRLVSGSFGLLKTQIKMGGRTLDTDFRLFGSRLEYMGFREHSATENLLFQGKINWKVASGSETQWTAQVFHSPEADDPGGLTAAQAAVNPRQAHPRNLLYDAGEEVQQEMMGLKWRKLLSAHQELNWTVHMIHRDFSGRLPFTSGGQVAFRRWAPGTGLKYINRHAWLGKPNQVIAGIDFLFQNDHRQRFDNNFAVRGTETLNQKETVDNLGVYLRNERVLTDRWEIVAGGRFDRIHYRVSDDFRADGDQSGSQSLSRGSGTLGVLYHLAEQHRLFANAATVFETPTTTELINNPSGSGGFNPSLEPQTSYSLEFGIKGNHGVEYEATLFYIHTEDEITPFELPAFPGRTFFRNSGITRRRGAETWLRWAFHRDWQLTASYTFSDFQFGSFIQGGQSFKENHLPGIPMHRAAGQIRYQHPMGMFARFQAEYASSLFANNENTVKNEAYTATRLETGLEHNWGSFRGSIFAGINNVLDEVYNANVRINAAAERFFEPAPPFNWFGGVSLRWTSF